MQGCSKIIDFATIQMCEMYRGLRSKEQLYECLDYLSTGHQNILVGNSSNNSFIVKSTHAQNKDIAEDTNSIHTVEPLSISWREQIVAWQYCVVDNLGLSREVVAQAMNYLDRYLCLCPMSKWSFQLASATSLFIAAKVCLERTMPLSLLVRMSDGKFNSCDVLNMEQKMLDALQWRLNPPLPTIQTSFLLKPLLRTSIPRKDIICEITDFLTENSVIDYFFVPFKHSIVALAAVFAAFDIVGSGSDIYCQFATSFVKELEELAQDNVLSEDVHACMLRMKETFHEGGYSLDDFDIDSAETKTEDIHYASYSPIGVTDEASDSRSVIFH